MIHICKRPSRVRRSCQFRRLVALVCDVQNIRTLSKLKLEKLALQIWRGDFHRGATRDDISSILIKTNVQIPKFNDIRLTDIELKSTDPSFIRAILDLLDEPCS